jgi:hypothetical protein
MKKRIISILVILLILFEASIIIFPFGEICSDASASISWTITTDTDFNSGVFDSVNVNGTGPAAELNLTYSESVLISNFGTNGIIAFNPSSGLDYARALAMDNDSIYIAGFDQVPGNIQWRIEKRNKTTGVLDLAFDGDGIVTTNPSANPDELFSIGIDSEYIYVVGRDEAPGNRQWRIEKRNKTSGALVTAFDNDGIVTNNPTSGADSANSIVIDSNYIYVSGYQWGNQLQWRLEKRYKNNGSLVNAFDSDGVINPDYSVEEDYINSIAIDSEFLYIAGHDSVPGYNDNRWRIEKRNKTTGALNTSFDGDGIVIVDPSTSLDRPGSIAVDSNYVYCAGWDSAPGLYDYQWRIEKRFKSNGSLDTKFDLDGILTNNPSTGTDYLFTMAINSTNIFVGGLDQAPGNDQFRLEKRDIITGALIPSFDNDGIFTSNPSSGGDLISCVKLDEDNVYFSGYDSAPGNPQWHIEKRGSGYNDTGRYYSIAHDSGISGTRWNIINWTENAPPGTDITFATRSGDTSTPDNSWSAWSIELTNPAGGGIISPRSRYLQFRATLSSSNHIKTPFLKEVTLSYTYNSASVPTLNGPTNDTWIKINQPTFTWVFNDGEADTQESFIVEIDDDQNFNSIDYTSGEVTSFQGSWKPSGSIPDGVWNWRVRTQDNYGMWSGNSSVWVTKIDVVAPEDFIPTADPGSWTSNVQPVITFSTTDATSGIDYYEVSVDGTSHNEQTSPYTLPPQPEGIHNVTIKAYDKAGNYKENYVYVYIDFTPPDSLQIIAETSNWTTNTQPAVAFLATDQMSGVDHYEVKIDDGDYSIQTSPYLLPVLEDGIHIFNVKAYDLAGNYNESSINIYIDTVKPNDFTPIVNPSAWTSNNQPEIIFYTTDETSGVDHYDVKIDGSNYTTQDSPYKLPQQTDGIHLVIIRAYDMAGNYREVTVEVYIDTITPNEFFPSADPGSWTSNNQPLITFYTTDDTSGIDYYEVKVDNTGYSIQESHYELPPQTDGTHTVTVRAYDMAGNLREATVDILIDTTPPLEFTPTADPGTWTQNTQPEISFETTDATSGISRYDVKVGGDEFVNKISPYMLPPLADGIHTITVRAYDLAGNYREESVKVYVDTTPPNDFEPSTEINDWMAKDQPEIYFNTTDNTSGIDHFEVKVGDEEFTKQASPYILPILADGVHTVIIRAYDLAGNYKNSTLKIKIDTQPPLIVHQAVVKGKEEVEIILTVDITDKSSGVGNITLYYKLKNAESYSSQRLIYIGNNYSATISASEVTSDLEYYIEASDRSYPANKKYYGADGQTTTKPNSDTDIDISVKSKDEDTNIYLIIAVIVIIIIIVVLILFLYFRKKRKEQKEIEEIEKEGAEESLPMAKPLFEEP